MTNIDYEKKYKEALEKARRIKDGKDNWGYCDLTEITPALEEVFPELRESEDDRVIRTLYHLAKDHDWLNGATKDEVFAWLVKCKNSLHISETCKENANSFIDESEDEKMLWEFNDYLCEEIECRTNDLRDEKDRRTLNMLCYILTKVKDWLEKQKESLPVQEVCKENADSFTDDEDRRIKNSLINLLYYTHPSVLARCRVDLNKAVAYLERQKKQERWRVGENAYFTPEQKPAEWSEKYIADIFEKVGLARIVREQGNDELTNAVQSAMIELSKGYKQEWNERDEKILASAISHIEDSQCFDHFHDISKDDIYDWLKSLRPSWKPSEEQMKDLYNAENALRKHKYIAIADKIAELHYCLEQLKQP